MAQALAPQNHSSSAGDSQFASPGSSGADAPVVPSYSPPEATDNSGGENLNAQQPPSQLAPPNFADFKAARDGKKVEAKAPEQKKAEEPQQKPTDTPQNQENPELPKLPEFKPADKTPTQRKPRDYSGIEEADLPTFKAFETKMGHEAFDYTKKLYVENKRLAKEAEEAAKSTNGKLPGSYYNNPDGYKLSPDFTKLEQDTTLAGQFLNHWEQQQIAIDMGQPIQKIVWDESSQRWGLTQPIDATPQDKMEVARNIRQCAQQLQGVQQKRDAFANEFKVKQEASVAEVKQLENLWFKDWNKPDHPTQPWQKQYAEKMPQLIKDSPAANMLVMGRVLVDMQNARIQELTKELEVERGKKGITNVQPKRDEIPAGNGNGKANVPSFSDFQNRIKAAH